MSRLSSSIIIPPRPFYLLRHGQSEFNAQERAAGGGVDTPLTDLGREQARQVADFVSHLPVKPSRVYHSHLSRARDTAKIVNEALGLEIGEAAGIHEHMFGEWEGIPWTQLQSKFSAGMQPPGGEPWQEFAQRVGRSIGVILEKDHAAPPLIVAHGGVFRGFGRFHGVQIPNIGNCELRLFTPKPADVVFPWEMEKLVIDKVAKSARMEQVEPLMDAAA